MVVLQPKSPLPNIQSLLKNHIAISTPLLDKRGVTDAMLAMRETYIEPCILLMRFLARRQLLRP